MSRDAKGISMVEFNDIDKGFLLIYRTKPLEYGDDLFYTFGSARYQAYVSRRSFTSGAYSAGG